MSKYVRWIGPYGHNSSVFSGGELETGRTYLCPDGGDDKRTLFDVLVTDNAEFWEAATEADYTASQQAETAVAEEES